MKSSPPLPNSLLPDLKSLRSLVDLALASALVFAMGCASPQPPIRFGIFQVPRKNLADARALGMDFVVGSSQRDYLDAAAAEQLKAIARPQSGIRHPAIMGSILTDEPDLHGISPEKMAAEYKAAKKTGPRPVFLNLSSGFSAEAYVRDCDVLMFDWFPVNWMPLETFYSHLRATRLAAGRKPFCAVIQTFDWSKYPELMPAGSYRKPTPAEIKAMTVWAAMNGAKGIAYYPFDDGHASLAESPEIASAIKQSIELVRNYDWLFESPRAWMDYPFQFERREDKTNAIAETSIAVRATRLPENPGTVFVVAANTTDRAITVKPLVHFDEAEGEIRFEPLEVKFLIARQN
jgi:hypothetical protein